MVVAFVYMVRQCLQCQCLALLPNKSQSYNGLADIHPSNWVSYFRHTHSLPLKTIGRPKLFGPANDAIIRFDGENHWPFDSEKLGGVCVCVCVWSLQAPHKSSV